jgi:lysophospholipase L1-like esterase
MRAPRAAIVLVLWSAALFAGRAAAPEHWVGTWSTAVVPSTAPPPAPQFAGAAPPAASVLTFNNQTIRQIVHASVGGSRARVVFSNVFGTSPLRIGAARIARRDTGAAIVAGSSRALSFGGQPATTIPAGAEMFTDAVEFQIAPFADLAIDLFLPDDTSASPRTLHSGAAQTNYVDEAGDRTGAADFPSARTINSWFFLERVEVVAPPATIGVVTFGDSITDGTGSTANANRRWPDDFARRLAASRVAVMNQGIAGNRLLSDAYTFGFGVSALARLDRDLLAQTGATDVVVLEGINDIGMGRAGASPTADELIAAHRQIVMRAHAHGLKAFGAPLLPFEGAAYFSAEGETKRQAVNAWIRTSGVYDGVIDFERAVADPEQPAQLLPALQRGDHLHPNDAGYTAMADAIDLKLFTRRSGR